ncbi:MAG: carbohydrate ABC transporter permease [Eubacteriales bacterium]
MSKEKKSTPKQNKAAPAPVATAVPAANAQAALMQGSPAAPRKKRKIVSLDKKKARAGWFFILPFVIGLVLIYLPIIFDSVKLSFNEMIPVRGGGFKLEFVGLANYQEALLDGSEFYTTLMDGLAQLFIDIPAIVIFSLFMAVMLNQKMIGRAAFRAIFFVPVILSTGLMAEIDAANILQQNMENNEDMSGSQVESNSTQIISAMEVSALFETMKVGTGLVSTVTNLVNDVYNIINRSGVQMLIFLAGLQSISPHIYEACSIDGATTWETFWKITFPMISPMILVNTVYTVIDSFTGTTNSVMSFIQTTYNEGSKTVSSAMAWVYFIIVIAVVGLVSAFLSAYIFYQRRD